MRYERLADIVRLAMRLQDTGGLTLDEIQAGVHVSRRTAERMRDAGEHAFGPLELADTRREDRTRSAGLTLSHRKVSWEGYQPVLMFDWSRIDSNVPLYDRKLLSLRLGLRRLF